MLQNNYFNRIYGVSKNFGGLANTLGDHFGGQPMNSGEH